MLRAERETAGLLAPIYAGHELAGGLGAIPQLGWDETIVAVAARLARLAEILQQRHAPTARRLAQTKHAIELAHRNSLVGIGGFRLLDESTLLDHISQAVGHER